MKALVLFNESKDERFYTNSELLKYWEKLSYVEGIDEVNILKSGGSSFADYDRLFGDYDIVLNTWITSNAFKNELFDRHPNLKYVSTFSHGFEPFDFTYTRKRNITVTNTIYGDTTISEHALALLMEVVRQVPANQKNMVVSLLRGDNSFYANTKPRQIELYGKTAGIIGLGNIGYQFARVLDAMGMKILACSTHEKKGEKYKFINQVSMDVLLKKSDVISIHCPLNENTYHLLDKEALSKVKPGVIIINTARGAIIDEKALCEGLKSGRIYAAGLDVFEEEPITAMPDILNLPNVFATPHSAFCTRESRFRVIDLQIENLKHYLEGKPTSVING